MQVTTNDRFCYWHMAIPDFKFANKTFETMKLTFNDPTIMPIGSYVRVIAGYNPLNAKKEMSDWVFTNVL